MDQIVKRKIKVEQGADARARKGTEILAECVVYAPIYLLDDRDPEPTGEATLFVRRYRLLRLPSGSLVVRWSKDVESFENDDAMVERIEREHLAEMPAENPEEDWMPRPIRVAIETDPDNQEAM